MSLLQVNVSSRTLENRVNLWVVLPVDRKLGIADEDARTHGDFPTLYLLHGHKDSAEGWVLNTRVKRWAEERGIALVMPHGMNSFYLDHPSRGKNYSDFIGRELIELTREMFHLSHKREDTYIGGLSMGGFGALYNGFKYRDVFGGIASLSGAFILDDEIQAATPEEGPGLTKAFYRETFGYKDLSEAVGSDRYPFYWIEKAIAEKADMPRIHLSCGTEDTLIGANRRMHAYLGEKGIDHTYYEAPGIHDWYFWDGTIEKVLDWMTGRKEDGTAFY